MMYEAIMPIKHIIKLGKGMLKIVLIRLILTGGLKVGTGWF